VVDAAGAIYVIGGDGFNGIYYSQLQDVWASTDGGARAGLSLGDGRGCTAWVLRG
jgi:hypothetical protein